MRRARVVAVTVLPALLAGCSGSTGGVSASCVAPYVDDQGPTGTAAAPAARVVPGEALTVYGHWYAATCHDTNPDGRPPRPLPPVRLTLHLPGGAVQDLGTFTPSGADLGFTATVRIPRATATGSATVSDDLTPPAVYRFTVERS